MRALIASIVGVTALAVAATLVTLVRLLRAARSPSPQRGDVILVFGAAVSANGPSPALRARVEHAARLYREARAPLVLCGGTALETGAMRTLLRQGGVLERAILSEQAISTRETVGAAIRRGNGGWHRVLAVSSRYHMHRVLAEARRQGLPAVGCPAPRPASGAPASSPRARLLLPLLQRHAYEVAATWWYAISARQARP